MKLSTFILGTANGIALAALFGPLPEWSIMGLALLAGLTMALDDVARHSPE